jgi:C1A family cysteine protease
MRRFGWIPDVPDQRDFRFARVRARVKIKDSVDLRSLFSGVEDQGDLGSCTAQALVGVLEFLENANKEIFEDKSRLFVYYNEREIEGTVREDSGAMLRTGIKALKKLGSCSEKLWPYDIDCYKLKPAQACYRQAKKHLITSYQRLVSLDDSLGCLSDGFPFVFGFGVYDSFMTKKVEKTGIVPMPKRSERMLGGHAVVAVGYNLKDKMMLVRNSWGEKWGMEGYCLMPFGFFTNRNLSDDFWAIRKEQ